MTELCKINQTQSMATNKTKRSPSQNNCTKTPQKYSENEKQYLGDSIESNRILQKNSIFLQKKKKAFENCLQIVF